MFTLRQVLSRDAYYGSDSELFARKEERGRVMSMTIEERDSPCMHFKYKTP